MKIKIGAMFISIILISCLDKNSRTASKKESSPIVGTWRLITGTLIEKGDTTVTEFNNNIISFIKIINDTHFAFLQHDVNKGKDSSSVFVSGGGKYTLTDSVYTEHLEYCSARDWEGNDFKFTISIKNDTLTQSGIEKVESSGIDRLNIERYVRMN